MMKKIIIKLLNRYDIWQWTQIILIVGIVISSGLLVQQLIVSPYFENDAVYTPTTNFIVDGNLAEIAQIRSEGFQEVGKNMRQGLFKPENPQRDKPMADKTIERIRSQLKLQCIMDLNGEPVAYINIQGVGLRKCTIGENTNDLFTVLDINKQNKSVDISIVEHKVTLHL